MADKAWAGAVSEVLRELEAAAVAGDWTAADQHAETLASTLAAAPPGVAGEAVFRHACRAVGRVSAAALAARSAVQIELQALANGRKAVAAYR